MQLIYTPCHSHWKTNKITTDLSPELCISTEKLSVYFKILRTSSCEKKNMLMYSRGNLVIYYLMYCSRLACCMQLMLHMTTWCATILSHYFLKWSMHQDHAVVSCYILQGYRWLLFSKCANLILPEGMLNFYNVLMNNLHNKYRLAFCRFLESRVVVYARQILTMPNFLNGIIHLPFMEL